MVTDSLFQALGTGGGSGAPAPASNGLGGAGSGGDDFLEQLKRMLSKNTAYTPDSLSALLRAILDGGDGGNGGGGNGGLGGPGCLHGDTLVRMADGSEKPAREIVVEDLIMGYDFDLKQDRPQSVFTVQASRQPCFKVTLESGKEIVASASHIWFAENDDLGDEMAFSLFATSMLKVHWRLISEGGDVDQIASIEDAGSHIVYWWNCTMNHNYYAGGVLHHNEGGGLGAGGAIGANTYGGGGFYKGSGGGGSGVTLGNQGSGGAGNN